MSLLLEIVTPEKKVFSDQANSLTLPTTEGEIGILPGHLPLITQLIPGHLVVQQGQSVQHLAVDRGFAEVFSDKVSVLTEGAIDVKAIDLTAIEAAQARAEAALAEAQKQNKDPAEIEQIERLVRFAIAQKLVKRSR